MFIEAAQLCISIANLPKFTALLGSRILTNCNLCSHFMPVQ
jgi:hypothetical protein